MARFTVQNNGAYGIELPGGIKYDADRGGHIDVPNDAHAAAIKSSKNTKVQWIGETPWTFEGAKDNTCPQCAFNAFAFTAICPRCNTPLGDAA